jgi:hypothetical protein
MTAGSQSTCWILILCALLLLISHRQLDLLWILIPLALLLAFAFGCSRSEETSLTDGAKKG